MKKAVIATGGKQYIVAEGETIEVELLQSDKSTVEFTPLLIIDGEKIVVGTPSIQNMKVITQVIEPVVAGAKVTAIRYKPKKRVHKLQGHRQKYTQLKITKIS